MVNPSLLILADDAEWAKLEPALYAVLPAAGLTRVAAWEDLPAAKGGPSPDALILGWEESHPALPDAWRGLPTIRLLPPDQPMPTAELGRLYLGRDAAGAYLRLLPVLVGQQLELARERARRGWLERALSASSHQLQQVISGSQNIIFSVELNGHLRAVNPAFTTVTGWPVGDWIGRNLVDLVHDDEQASFAVALNDAAAGETQRLAAVRLRTQSGKWAVVEVTLTPYPQADGRVELFAMARDVTRHVQALRALARERDRMAILFEALPATISWISADLRYLAVNKQLAAIHDLSPDEYVGQPLGFDSPEAGGRIRGFVGEMFASPESEGTLELDVEVGGGEKCFLIVAHKYRQGEEIVLVGVDITRIKQTEETQLRQLQELSVLQAISTAGALASDEDALITEATEIIGGNLYPDNFGVLLWDEGSDFLRVHPSYHLSEEVKLFQVPLDASVTGKVLLDGEPARIDDISELKVYCNGDPATRSELCVPLRVGDRVIGVLNAESTRIARFADTDERLLTTIAGQLAIAIERLRREANERRQAQQLATIYDVGRRISSILDTPTLLNEVVRLLVQNLRLYNAAIAFVKGDQLAFEAGYGGYEREVFESSFTPTVTNPLFAGAIESGRAWLIDDVREYEEDYRFGLLPAMRAHLAVPLQRQGQVVGVLAVSSREPRGLTRADGELLEILADHVSIALENARLYQALREQAQELSGLYETALATSGILDRERLLDQLYAQVSDLIDPDVFLVAMYDARLEQLEVVRAVEEDLPLVDWTGFRTSLDEGGLTGWVMRERKPLYIEDLENEEPPVEPRSNGRASRSWLGVPLMAGDWLIGALSLQSFAPSDFSESQQRFVASVSNQIALALRNAQLFEQAGERTRQLTHLNELTHAISGLLDVEALVRTVTEQLVGVFGFQATTLVRFSPEGDWLPAGPEEEALARRAGDASVREALRKGQTIALDRLATGEDEPMVSCAALATPLRVGGQVPAALVIASTTLRRFGEAEHFLIKTVADQLGVALEKARLFAEAARRTAELETIADISSLLRATRTVDDVLPLVLPRALAIVDGVQGELFLIEPDSDDLVLRAVHPPNPAVQGQRQTVAVGVTGHVARTGEVRVSPVLKDDPLFYQREEDEEALTCRQLGSVVSLPVRAAERVIGVLHVGLDQVRAFRPGEIRLLTAVADIAGSALYRAQVMESLEEHVAERTHELALAHERLKGLDKLKSKFVSDISHELRTPISNLRLYSELMEKGKPEKRHYYLNVLREETMRLVDIVEPILNYSQIGQDLIEARLEPVHLNTVVGEVLQERQSEAMGRGIVLAQELDPALPLVLADRLAMVRLTSNLVENAVTYTSEGTVSLRTFTDGDQDLLCLEVEDEGAGIPADDLPHIFEWFYRGLKAGQSNIPGAGLGLATVKATAEQFGGRVDVESELGQGTIFRIWLPIYYPTGTGRLAS